MNRRKFIKKSAIGVTGMGLLTGLYTWQIEPFWLEMVYIDMPVKKLPKELEGKTIMQISDIHVGNRFDYQYIIESFQKAQALQPDIVVYTGDYVSYENEEQFQQFDEVLQHVVKGKLGTVGILGNHDYGHAWSEQEVANHLVKQLEDKGVQILINQKQQIAGLDIIGIDDLWGLNFDAKKAMQLYDKNNPSLVLCHNPDVCDMDVWNNYKGWILSGHTHGGQCKPPFLPPPILPVENKRYAAGEIDLYDGRTLYINRALGCSWQVRFNVRPEITIFTLQTA